MRVEIDALDYTDEHIYTYEGKPFTGIAYETSCDGKFIAEETYTNGVLEGPSKEWYPNRKLKSEVYYKAEAPHGICKGWFQNGTLMSQCIYEYGILIQKKVWDEKGTLIEDYHIDKKDSRSDIIKIYKEAEKKYDK